jgi:predicted subunit of tRNA(5-methylaminomethyl-2-thiouridylate) methyltransferase
MEKSLFKNYASLGFINPFYYIENNEMFIESDLETLMKSKETINEIDSTSIVELINKGHIFGDRTLIKGCKLTPWMAVPKEGKWSFKSDLPKHDLKKIEGEQFATLFFEKLKNELRSYIGESKSVGILLSGGMDSRILAAAVKNLQDDNLIETEVTAITWGTNNCRDVAYAENIAKQFGWEWSFFELTAIDLEENINICAENGALFSPIHLHAMPRIANMKGIDLILAGSYGDSVGRAEYSGTKVTNLVSIGQNIWNKFKLVKNNVFSEALTEAEYDIKNYYSIFPRKHDYEYYELEKQIHYMRKQLNQCMGVINKKIPLYQAFCSPDIFGFIWSVDPELRTDRLYFDVLNLFSPELLEIPWARTGSRYLKNDKPDNLDKDFHQYGSWIRNYLLDKGSNEILSDTIKNLNIFNRGSLKALLKLNRFIKGKHTSLDEYLIWICSLSLFVNKYKVEAGKTTKYKFLEYQFGYCTSIVQFLIFQLMLKIKNARS